MKYRHTTHLHGDFLDGDLTSDERKHIERHLAQCADCREDMERLKRLGESLKQIETPDPGSEYFDALSETVLARTASIPISQSIPTSERIGSSRRTLLTLIKLAATVTLLFSAFYISDFKQEQRATRWAEHIRQVNLVRSDGAGADQQLMPLSAGVNTLLGQPGTDDKNEEKVIDGTNLE